MSARKEEQERLVSQTYLRVCEVTECEISFTFIQIRRIKKHQARFDIYDANIIGSHVL